MLGCISLHVVVLLAHGFFVVIDLLLHEVAFLGTVAVQAVALTFVEVRLGRVDSGVLSIANGIYQMPIAELPEIEGRSGRN